MKKNSLLVFITSMALLTGFWGCEKNPKKPGYEFLPDMAHSVPYDSFAPNPNTPDHKTLQLPPEGSIPRGFLPYHYGDTPEEAERAGRELKSPVTTTPDSLARGKKVYETFCLACHGETGKGDGPLIPKFPNPPSFTSKTLMEYPEGRFFHIMTKGSGMMPSHASQVSPEDRWKVVQYIFTLQKRDPHTSTEVTP